MLRTLLALFRPLHTIANALVKIADLYEMELRERRVNPHWTHEPLTLVTEKPKRGDVEITYQGDVIGPRYKQVDWQDDEEFE